MVLHVKMRAGVPLELRGKSTIKAFDMIVDGMSSWWTRFVVLGSPDLEGGAVCLRVRDIQAIWLTDDEDESEIGVGR